MLEACRRKSLFTSHEWPPSNAAKHSHHTVAVVCGQGRGALSPDSRFRLACLCVSPHASHNRGVLLRRKLLTWTQERQGRAESNCGFSCFVHAILVGEGIVCSKIFTSRPPRQALDPCQIRPWLRTTAPRCGSKQGSDRLSAATDATSPAAFANCKAQP